MSRHSRQGDLLYVRHDTQPAAALTTRPSIVMVAGVVSRHAHRLTAGAVLEAPAGTLSLALPYTAKVVHEEHTPIPLARGLWLVARRREDYPEAIRTVLD